MSDNLITYETAKLPKEKGFNIPTLYYHATTNNRYSDDDKVNGYSGSGIPPNNRNSNIGTRMSDNEVVELYSAPTQSLLQKWLREKHKIYIEPIIDGWGVDDNSVSDENICYRGFIWEIGKSKPKPYDDIGASDYEHILEIALVDALNLIK